MTRAFTENEIAGLIEKLKAATGPDHELDAAIWLLITPGATRKKWSYTHTATGRLCEVDETRDFSRRLIIIPTFTASIDAALTLVPEHHSYELTQSSVEPPAMSRCRLWDWRRSPCMSDPGNEWLAEGNRPLAINIVIAALKARASIRESGTRPTGEPGVPKPPSPEASGPVGRGLAEEEVS